MVADLKLKTDDVRWRSRRVTSILKIGYHALDICSPHFSKATIEVKPREIVRAIGSKGKEQCKKKRSVRQQDSRGSSKVERLYTVTASTSKDGVGYGYIAYGARDAGPNPAPLTSGLVVKIAATSDIEQCRYRWFPKPLTRKVVQLAEQRTQFSSLLAGSILALPTRSSLVVKATVTSPEKKHRLRLFSKLLLSIKAWRKAHEVTGTQGHGPQYALPHKT